MPRVPKTDRRVRPVDGVILEHALYDTEQLMQCAGIGINTLH